MRIQTTILMALLLAVSVTAAQDEGDSCPVLAATSATAEACADTLPGELCYGSGPLVIEPEADNAPTEQGEVIDFAGLDTVRTSALNADGWGLALMRVPTTSAGQALTYVLMGNTELVDESGLNAPITLASGRVTFSGGANLRAEPSAEAALAGQLFTGAEVRVAGRSADASWLWLLLDDGATAWVSAELVAVDTDAPLPVVTSGDDPPSFFNPMQAFTLHTGINDAPCPEAPESGLLVQSDGSRRMIVNEMLLTLDGTAFLQDRDGLVLTVVEGTASVQREDQTVDMQAGQRLRQRTDDLLRAVEDYEYIWARRLPLGLLPRRVDDLPVNFLGVVTPSAPGPLEGVTADAPCRVGAPNSEGRVRSGPGREYPIIGGLSRLESAEPDGRAVGNDGMIWWRLREGIWVRSDVVVAVGNCSGLPEIEPPALQSDES